MAASCRQLPGGRRSSFPSALSKKLAPNHLLLISKHQTNRALLLRYRAKRVGEHVVFTAFQRRQTFQRDLRPVSFEAATRLGILTGVHRHNVGEHPVTGLDAQSNQILQGLRRSVPFPPARSPIAELPTLCCDDAVLDTDAALAHAGPRGSKADRRRRVAALATVATRPPRPETFPAP